MFQRLFFSYWYFLHPSFWPIIAAAAIGAGASYLGAQKANQSAADNSQAQIDFQREMSNSAYQRATVDMKKAGLNPMLAYSQGGASTPSGAAAPVTNELGAAVEGAKGGAQSVAQARQMEASTDLSKAATIREVATARANNASANQTELQTAAAVRMLEAQAKGEEWSSRSKEFRSDVDQDERFRSSARRNAEGDGRLEASRRSELGLAGPLTERAGQDAKRARAERLLREYQVPGAKRESDYYKDPWGGKYDMYIPDFGSVLNSAGSAARLP